MDGGSAQRRVVAVVTLEAEPDVGVDGGGNADVGVAEEFLDDDEFDALFQKGLSIVRLCLTSVVTERTS